MQGKNIFSAFILTIRGYQNLKLHTYKSDTIKKTFLLCLSTLFFLNNVQAQTPVITPKLPQPVIIKLDATGHRTVLPADVTDNISPRAANFMAIVSPASFDCSSLGPQTVIVTASNGPGNIATLPVQVIVVSTPVFANHPDVTIPTDDCHASMPDFTTSAGLTNACTNVNITQVPAAGTPLTVNEPTIVTLTAADTYGGTAATFFMVTSYSVPQIFSKPEPIVIKLNENGNYTLQASDLGQIFNCDGAPVTTIPVPQNLTCADLGNKTITLTASTIRPNPQAVTFSVPTDAVTDPAGNIYIADGYSCSIRKIAADGTVTTFAGGSGCGYADGTGITAKFNVVNGITIDPQGNLYVVDESDRVRKITPDAQVSTLAGNGQNESVDGTGISASFNDPRGIAIDGAGNLYVTQNDFLVRKVTPTGMVTTLTASPLISKLNTPIGITTDMQGNLYVTDYTSAIKKIAPNGTITIIAGHSGQGFDDGAGAAATFNLPKGIVRDNVGNLYVTDSKNNAIRKIDPSGVVTTLQLHAAIPTDKATLNNPIGIKFDPFGNLIVVDTDNERIVRITPTGQLTTIAGNGVVGNNNGNANTPATLGTQISKPIPIIVTNSLGSTTNPNGITPAIASYPLNATVCAGNEVQFVATIPSGDYVNSYQWRVNNTNRGTNSPFFNSSTLHDGDVVICIVSNHISCTVPQPSLPIIVHIKPAPQIIFNDNPTIKQGDNITLNPELHGDIVSLRWGPAVGLSSISIANPVASPSNTITYYLTATSSLNCETTVPVTVNVISPINIPNTFTPNGDGFNDRWLINDLLPFPACVVDVFNRYGQLLFHSVGYGRAWDGIYNGGKLPPGTYYYMIDLKNGDKPLSGWVAILR